MMALMMIILIKMMKKTNPMQISVLILFISLFSSFLIFKVSTSSWISFVVVLTFSSGMMTLYLYTTSLTSNEMSLDNKNFYIFIVIIMFCLPLNNTKIMKDSMKMFSSQLFLIMMMIVLIMSMLAISFHGHHPAQALSSSF